MALRKIATVGHPILREPAREIAAEQLAQPQMQDFIDDLVATMRDANGAGLAAPQVYEPVRICAIEVSNNPRYPYKPDIPLTILVNPRIRPQTDATFENYEGCLSVPNLRGRVRRFCAIEVEAWDRYGEPIRFAARGLTAGTYQHELDHLDGVLFLDRLTDTRSLCTWEHFERFEKARFIAEARAVVEQWGE